MGSARRIWTSSVLFVGASLAITLIGANSVLAQTVPASGSPASGTPASGTPPAAGAAPAVGVTAPQPTQPTPGFGFEQALPPEQGSPRTDDYGERTRTIYQPSYVKGTTNIMRTSRTSGVRIGIAGWTSDRIPYDFRESSGFPALGLTIEWGTPMEPPAEPAKPSDPR
jgi:hypothetical protein